jgi:hypothetical protein
MHNLRVESEGPECWSTKWARQATAAADGSSRASCAVATRQKGLSNPTWLRHHRMPRRPLRYCQDNAASLVTQHGLLLSDQEVVCVSWRPRFFPGPLTSRLRETHYLREAPGRLGHCSSRVTKCNLFPVSLLQFSEFRGETSSPAARGPATKSANSPPSLAAPPAACVLGCEPLPWWTTAAFVAQAVERGKVPLGDQNGKRRGCRA